MGKTPGRLRAAAILSIVAMTGCTVTLVSDYDDTFDQQATTAQKDVDALLTKIAGNVSANDPTRTGEQYAADKDAYAKIHGDIDAMKVRAAAHSNNAATIDQVARIEDAFNTVEAEQAHADPKGGIHIAQAEILKNEMNAAFTILIRTELLKKSGTGSSSSK
jgi:hypothetical protein